MDDPTPVLRAIDRLEVGPVRVEAQRLTAPYTIHQGGAIETTELAYKYEERVFEPGEPASENLAAMIAAQVALNYGLFCKEMVFHGLYDDEDRRFLEEMARNTAREIYVNKLLLPNPFLVGPARDLPEVELDDYLRAKLRFVDAGLPTSRPEPWQVHAEGHAVLSSGGKDSLLTYALLDEMGQQPHPIYLNESGRHWYTALNAHRYFRANVPNTARVWTSADRLFSWMLRRLPFVRQDFTAVRSDEYPIRLWTVAVFLFGALPLLRKRRIGRLLIGDEYDTTLDLEHAGIPHYGGLYDQSRYFDVAMSSYFSAKRWDIEQFSILRPMSEILIQKTLVERYPELQALQVSCHATHLVEDRARPCGRCEKCRRIVGMLVALGADPTRCGYDSTQVDRSLAALAHSGVHQEAEGAEHLFLLLSQRGHVPSGARGSSLEARPEVMKLRFSADTSPVEAIPQDLRAPLYRMLLEHADGAVARRGAGWAPFDPMGGRIEPPPEDDDPRRV